MSKPLSRGPRAAVSADDFREMLAAIEDGEVDASAATRDRIEGALAVLGGRSGSLSPPRVQASASSSNLETFERFGNSGHGRVILTYAGDRRALGRIPELVPHFVELTLDVDGSEADAEER